MRSMPIFERSCGIALLLTSCTWGCAGSPTANTSEDESTDEVGSTDTTTTDASEADESESESDGQPEPDLPPELPAPGPMVVMTFNILCSFCDDTYDPWEDRVGYISDTIARHDPDLVGLQELYTAEEVQQLLDLNPGYEALFYEDEAMAYADATIWWRADRYEALESGFYWLSPAPDTPYSVGFSPPQLPRLVAWVRLRELASDAELLFVDTHFDNNSPSQELSAPLLLERTEAQAGELPIVVVGDFNSKPDSTAYGILVNGVDGGGLALTDAFESATEWSVDTNQRPAEPYDPAQRIDHVLVAGGSWTVPWWVVDTWVYGDSQMHTSDHFAIAAELVFEG